MNWTESRWNKFLLLGVIFAAWACSDGGGGGCDGGCDGCDGCGGEGSGEAYVFPSTGYLLHQAIQVKLTEHGMEFIEQNYQPILDEVLEDGLSFCVERLSPGFGAEICHGERCDDGTEGCQLDVGINAIRLNPLQPNRLEARVNLRLVEELPFRIRAIGVNWISCYLEINGPNVPVSANVYFDVQAPPGERTHLRIETPEGAELDRLIDNLNLRVRRTGFLQLAQCGVLDLLRPVITGLLKDQLVGPIRDAVDGFTCRPCGNGCPGGSTCDSRDICMVSETRCLAQDLGLEGEFDVGGLLADFAPGLDARVGYLAYLGDYANALPRTDPRRPDSGLELAAQLGIAVEANACVPDPIAFLPRGIEGTRSRAPRSAATNAGTTPGGENYAVGIGVARSGLNLALWGAWASGALCLGIGAETVEQLTTSTFSLLVPSLRDLTGGRNLPMLLQLAPQRPPEIHLGLGLVTPAEQGPGTIEEPLLELELKDLDIDAYIYLHDRWLRVFTLNVDARVPAGVDVSAGNELYILLGDLRNAFTRVEARDGELLAQRDLNGLSNALPTLLGAVLPALTDALADPIELPEFFGYRLRLGPESVRGVDADPVTGAFETLGVFADIEPAPAVQPMRVALNPRVVALRPRGPQGAELARALEAVGQEGTTIDPALFTLVATLAVDAQGAPEGFEVSYRRGQGAWSMWQRGPEVTLADARLLWEGVHTFSLRVRPAGARGMTHEEITLTHRVSLTPPTVAVDEVSAEGVTLHVGHRVYDRDELQVRARWPGHRDAWVSLSGGILPWPENAQGELALEVDALDPSGNHERVTLALRVPGAPEPAALTPEPDAPGCAAMGGNAGAPWWAVVLLGLVFVGRRRLLLAALLVLVAGLGACGDDKAASVLQPCDEEGGCPEGLTCVDGFCVALPPPEVPDCTSASDCEVGEACVDGGCAVPTCTGRDDRCDIRCPEGFSGQCHEGGCICVQSCAGGCTGDTFCCETAGACQPLPDPCASQRCPDGQRPERERSATGDPYTCEVVAGACGCVDLDPLPMGALGPWLDASASPDGLLAVVTYNATYGDLMLGVYESQEIVWRYLDGVPSSGPITGAIAGPRGGLAAPGDKVGRHPSLAIASTGRVHIAYEAEEGSAPNSLRYATGSNLKANDFVFITVDDEGPTALYTTITVDAEDRPWIVYLRPRVQELEDAVEGIASYTAELRLARGLTATPSGPDDFERFVIATGALTDPCGGPCPAGTLCRQDRNLCQVTQRRGCDPECSGNARCFDDTLAGVLSCAVPAPSTPFEPPFAVFGMHPRTAWLPTGELAVVSYDARVGDLVMTTVDPEDPAAASSRVLDGAITLPDGTEARTGVVGAFPDVLVSETGEIFVTYMDVREGNLLFLNVGTGAGGVVDDGLRPASPPIKIARVGSGGALREVDGQLTAVYFDATRHEVVESRFSFDGQQWAWYPSELDGGSRSGTYRGMVGLYSRLVVAADGSAWVVAHRTNTRATPPQRDIVVIPR